MANARVEILAPRALTEGGIVVYESGALNAALLDKSLRPLARRVDLYGGNSSLASGASWPMQLYDPQGVFSEDGIFSPDLRDTLLVASVEDRVVFLGRARNLKHTASNLGIVTTVQWRDLVDDLASQRIEGISSDDAENQIIVAQTTLHSVLRSYDIPTEVVDTDGTRQTIPDLDLWFPEQSATLRSWILPVLAGLGYAVDWAAQQDPGGGLVRSFALTHESRFRNRATGLPRFTDRALLQNKATWDDGREQVFNIWTGTRRTYDAAEREFIEHKLTEIVDDLTVSQPYVSRQLFGERRAPIDLQALRVDEETMRGYVVSAIRRRLWPHPRGRMSLSGSAAAALRIGDGFVTDFKFNTPTGRGLQRAWRVIGRTVDLQDDVIEIEAEMRDARDEDYQDWQGIGGVVLDGDPTSGIIPPLTAGRLCWGGDAICWGNDSTCWGGE